MTSDLTTRLTCHTFISSPTSAFPCFMSMRKVVLTLTNKSAEIYLSMAGAKLYNDMGLSWFQS
jgi:hypothetical protein